jgi:hypothetical protein
LTLGEIYGTVSRVAERKANRRDKATELSIAVTQLSEEVRILRMAVDELRDDVVWAARQVLAAGYEVSGQPSPQPVDPLAPDADYQPYCPQHPSELPDGLLYCCESPRLAWRGPPDLPGIACENCGYLVAEEGNIEIWRSESASEGSQSEGPIHQQQHMFD